MLLKPFKKGGKFKCLQECYGLTCDMSLNTHQVKSKSTLANTKVEFNLLLLRIMS